MNVEVLREDLGCAVVLCIQEGDTLWVIVDHEVSDEFSEMVVSTVSSMAKLPGGWLLQEEPPTAGGEMPLVRSRKPRRTTITARLGVVLAGMSAVVGLLAVVPRWSVSESTVAGPPPSISRPPGRPPGAAKPVVPVVRPVAVLAPVSQARGVFITVDPPATATGVVRVPAPPPGPASPRPAPPAPCGLLCQVLSALQ